MRGRKPLKEPIPRDAAILEALRDGHKPSHVAKTYSISRQYVHEIMGRWPDLAPKKLLDRIKSKRKKNNEQKHKFRNSR